MAFPALAPLPVVPDNVKAARQQVQTSDFFALCYLMLCQLAYADEDNATKAVQQIIDLLPTMPVPDGNVKGKWNLGWGPVASPDNSNLLYAAEFLDQDSGLPVFAAVAIRGTDTQAQPSGVLKQIIEDLDAEHQVVFPDNNNFGSRIAHGTSTGLSVLTAFKDKTGRTVDQYVNDFVAANPRTPVVVTGHSLGGCQTTVLASYLSAKVPAGTSIVPNSFAAPTAGNSAFIQFYERTFPFCPRWFNPFDLVPMAFAGLGGIGQLWNQCNRPAPGIFKTVIDAFEILLKLLHASYSQQSSAESRQLIAACQPPARQAVAAAIQNAAVAEIQTLLQGAVKKLQHDISQLPIVGGVAAHTLSFNVSAASFNNIGDWVQELLFQHLVLTGYWNAVHDFANVAHIPNPFDQAQAAAAGNGH
ncbi:MAG TPA: alpha/beta fold hydrolase [Candidatus Angelobacter sp.]